MTIRIIKIDKDESGNIIGTNGLGKQYICDINDNPLYYLEELGKFLYKNQFINFCIFNQGLAKEITEHYFSKDFLTLIEKNVFLNLISMNINPYENPKLIHNFLQHCKTAEYQVSHTVIPDYLAYETWFPHAKENIPLEELKKIYILQKKILDKNEYD